MMKSASLKNLVFSRPLQSRLCYSVASVCLSVCLSSVCDVMNCGQTVRPRANVTYY